MIVDDTVKISALEAVACAFNESEFDWAVCNGLENYPENIGRDLDIVIEKGSLKSAVRCVIETLSPLGWIVVPNRQGWIWWVVAFKQDEKGFFHSLQVDLFCRLQWAFTWVVDGVGTDGEVQMRGPFQSDPSASIGKTFVLNALSSGMKAFEKKPKYLVSSEAEREVLPALLRRISGEDWPSLLEAFDQKDKKALLDQIQKLRKACRRESLKLRGLFGRVTAAFEKQLVVNWFPEQGAPVIHVTGFPLEVQENLLQTIGRELEGLVFQRTDIILKQSRITSLRDLKRRSCLQVVLVFAGGEIPKGLNVDLEIDFDGAVDVTSTSSLKWSEVTPHEYLSMFRALFGKYLESHSKNLLAQNLI